MRIFLKITFFMFVFVSQAFGLAAATNTTNLEKEKDLFSATVAYRASTNLQEKYKNTVNHRLIMEAAYQGMDPWSIGLGTSASFVSVDKDILQNNDNPHLEDLDLNVGREFKLGTINNLSSGLSWTLPTSVDAQYEQYHGVLTASNQLSTDISKYFVIINSLDVGYIANSNIYSPTTNEMNVESFASYFIKAVVKPVEKLSLFAAVGAKVSKYMDGTYSLDKSQAGTWSIGAGYKLKKFSFSAKFINGNYDDEGPARFFAQDQYKQIVSGGIGYEF